MNRLIILFLCLMVLASAKAQNNPASFIGTNLTRGDNLLILRLAVSCNGEYTQAVGGVANAQTNLNAWLLQINEIYGREYSVRFELIPNNSQLIYDNAAIDPWPTLPMGASGCTNTGPIRARQAAVIDSVIGIANYDFSHVITGGVNGGCAGAYKSGHSGGFDIGVTRHEMGHQFQQGHTLSNGGNNNFEPENAGRSIQGGNVFPFAHSMSFHQLANHIAVTEAGVGTNTPTGNTIPTANAGPDRIIPFGTPFLLSATATDPNANDVLTYVWDQLDGGIAQSLPPSDQTQGALFTRFIPTSSSSRTYPNLDSLLANSYSNNLEHLPTQARDLNFRLTVNDNHQFMHQGNMVNASGINNDDVKITVANAGPFAVTLPNTNVTFTGGTSQNITWDVNGTNAAPINTANVRISLSSDGGLTFPIILANSTTNDGIATVTVPNINTNQARVKIAAIDNIYFDVSNENFTIIQNTAIAGINISLTGTNTVVNENGQTDTYTIALLTNPTGAVTVTLTPDPQTEISLNGTTFSSALMVSLNNTAAQTITVRGKYDTLIEGPQVGSITHLVSATGDATNYPIDMSGQPVTVNISDAQIPAVVGVDFDVPSSTNSPNHWVRLNTLIGQTATNIPLDDGTPTEIDVSINATNCGIGGCAFGNGNGSGNNHPHHAQNLNGPLDGFSIARDEVQVVWSDLKPNTKYRLFVFANTPFGNPLTQSVTITGNGTDNPAPFVQNVNGSLTVNDQQSTNQPLLNFGKEVTSTGNGTISLVLTSSEVLISGLAIQEVLGNPNIPSCTNYPAITFPNGGEILTGASTQNITWTPATCTGTASNVRILLSTDGGMTFPTILSNSTPNDGAATITLPNSTSTQAVIKIESIGANFFDISNQNFSINQDPNGPLVNVNISGANTLVNESGQSDTYEIFLNTTPTGPVTVAINADAQTEVSLNGINFAATQSIVLTNITPRTITVRGKFDMLAENAHTGQVLHSISATNDPINYPIGFPGAAVIVNISDAQIAPVVGVDFDVSGSTNSPNHWVRLNSLIGQTATNIPLDDGTPTGIDIATNAVSCGFGGCIFGSGIFGTDPQHIQNIEGPLDGFAIVLEEVQVVWSDLKPNTKYRVFVFAHTPFGNTFTQTVTITGSGVDNPAPFAQTVNGGLAINDQTSSNQPLFSFGKEVTSKSDGTIDINVSKNGELIITGLAIQEVLGPPTTPMDGVQVSSKTYLEGPYNSGLMNDGLRSGSLIPSTEPYTALSNFTPVNGGGETVAASVLATTGNNAIVDWVYLELRAATNNATVMHTRAALLQRDGDIVDIDGISPVTFPQATAGNYFVAIRHRNHLGIMTSSMINLSLNPTNIDFTLSSTPTFGTNARVDLGNNAWGMPAGDLDNSGIVNASDRNDAWNTRNQTGYLPVDADMNGTSAASDRNITWNNRNKVQQLSN